jgi:hypothetical protein
MTAIASAAKIETLFMTSSDRSMSTAVIASVRAIAQAHAAFSRAAFGAVLLADSGIESQRRNRPSYETEQSNYRNEPGHHCLPG